jgi:hypothetical protein
MIVPANTAIGSAHLRPFLRATTAAVVDHDWNVLFDISHNVFFFPIFVGFQLRSGILACYHFNDF